jgi:hypothetical protein
MERKYPTAAACLAEDLPALCVHLKYLPRLRRFRSSNLLERSLELVPFFAKSARMTSENADRTRIHYSGQMLMTT